MISLKSNKKLDTNNEKIHESEVSLS